MHGRDGRITAIILWAGNIVRKGVAVSDGGESWQSLRVLDGSTALNWLRLAAPVHCPFSAISSGRAHSMYWLWRQVLWRASKWKNPTGKRR